MAAETRLTRRNFTQTALTASLAAPLLLPPDRSLLSATAGAALAEQPTAPDTANAEELQRQASCFQLVYDTSCTT